MPTKFNMTRDINGYNGFGLEFTDTAYSAKLAINTDTSLTVPASSGMGGYGISSKSLWIAIFSFTPGSSVWVALNAAAAVPAGAGFASTSSELNPAARLVKGGDVLHFFCASASVDVSVIFYSIS